MFSHPTRRTYRRWLPLMFLIASVVVPPLATAAPPPASASELLEKAIYTEETVGDLDTAVQLYEQVLAVAKDASQAAAQAQFRLGLCYQRQGKADLATAAFQAVIDNFPQQEQLVAAARQHLPQTPQLLPVPWVNGERLHLSMRLTTGLNVGTMIYMVDEVERDGRQYWQCSTRGLVTANGVNSYSRVLCDKETFAPQTSFWRHSLLGEATANYEDGQANVSIVGREDTVTINLPGTVWDNEQTMEVFRRLPLKTGYKSTLKVLSSLGGQVIELSLEVPETVTIEVPAGKFECFKLVLNIGQTFWVSTDEHRYIVRFEAGSVTADLARVEQLTPDQHVTVSGDQYSLTLPLGWQVFTPNDPSDREAASTYLLDPQAIAFTQLTVGPRSRLKPSEQTSPRAWTESFIAGAKQRLRGFTLRDPGIFELKLADNTATALIADHQDASKSVTMYGVAVFNGDAAINLRMSAPTDEFDSLRKEFDSIVNSLRFK